MKSKTVKLISGVAVLAVLSGTYMGVKSYVASQEEKEAEEADTSVSVVDVDSDEVSSISFTSTDGSQVVFEKDGDTWVKKGETDFPISQDTLTSAVNALTALDADQKLENPESLSEYDLDKPQNQITLTLKDGSETVLQVGMENESTSEYYLKKEDDDKAVYLVSNTALEPFMGTAYKFAKAEAFPSVTSATINDVKVEKENGYELYKDDDSLYWYVSDGKTSEQADTSKAGTVTSAIGSLTYGDFVDYNCTDEAKYGFDDPYAIITASYLTEEDTEADTDAAEASDSEEDQSSEEASQEDQSETENSGTDSAEEEETTQVEKQIVIYVGDETEGSRYVKVNDSKQVYTISEDSLTDILDSSVSDFYSLTVNYLTVNNLESLEVQSEDGTHTVEVTRETVENTEESTEEETSSEDEEADSADTTETKVSYSLDGKEIEETDFTTFYNKLINMAGQQRLTEEYKPDQDAAYTFVFTDTEGQKTTVSYYEYDSSFYAAVVGDKVYLVNKMNVRDLIEAYEEMLKADSSEETKETEESAQDEDASAQTAESEEK